MATCKATTKNGHPCSNKVKEGEEYCHVHRFASAKGKERGFAKWKEVITTSAVGNAVYDLLKSGFELIRESKAAEKIVKTFEQELEAIDKKIHQATELPLTPNPKEATPLPRELPTPSSSPTEVRQQLKATPTPELSDKSQALVELGNTCMAQGLYQQAAEHYQQGLAIAQEVNNRRYTGVALGNLGTVSMILGHYQQAAEYHQQELAIAQELDHRSDEAASLCRLGQVYLCLGEYLRAIEYHQKALTIAEESKDHYNVGAFLIGLGIGYEHLGEYQRAIEYYQRALSIANDLNDLRRAAPALNGLGSTYEHLGEYQQAIEYYQRALSIADGLNDRRGAAAVLANLGIAYKALGDRNQARRFWKESLRLYEELNVPDVKDVRQRLEGLKAE